ncbi:hypothetical protein ONZ45_g17706 [Pleurotus djamor]|nr:hypothetical protein ONZ45_g17706 [Pleurotus djamor]
MVDPISPHKPGSGFTSFAYIPINSEGVRSALKAELSGRIVVYSEQVMRRLRIADVSDAFVANFLKNFEQRQSNAISSLRALVADSEGLHRSRSKKSEVKAMCPYLQMILDDITEFESGSAQRYFNNTHNVKLKGEAHLSGFPAVSPDFWCGQRAVPGDPYTWRGMDSFLEVKPTSAQGLVPKSADPKEVVSGSKFVVAIFDRDGVTVSSDYDMWQDIEVFVRVIRQITHGLSPIELGQDPSVQELPSESPLFHKVRTKQVELGVPPATLSFPSYLLTCPRQLRPRPATPFDPTAKSWTSDLWVTIGPPIWTSLSLCGRSTSIWRATRVEDGNTVNINKIHILKNSWRHSNRDSESDIYQGVETHPSGIAKFLQGGDVMVPGTTDVIRIDHLRNPNQTPGSYAQVTSILHRLILNTTGRALWEGDSYLDIVKGVLFTQNILHRDASPGNVLLSERPTIKPGEEGFLTDLDFARIQTIVSQDVQDHRITDGSVPPSQHTPWEDAKHGAQMTFHDLGHKGTLQFMAMTLHVVDSFIWVLAYAVARRAILETNADSDMRKKVSTFFADAWGSTSNTASVVKTKRALTPLYPPPEISSVFPKPILSLFLGLRNLIVVTQLLDPDPEDPSQLIVPFKLTYEDVFSRLDRCILALESPSYNGLK